MATSFDAVFGGGTGAPLGAIVAGQFANNASYLPCDGGDYLAASYPLLDKTNLVTTGTNAWTARTLPTTQSWNACAFGNGVFVALSANTSTTAASSTDGQTWTARTIPSGSYCAVIYANNLFVAVGASVCATSPDGITWTARTIPAVTYSGIAYGAGLFVAVALSSASVQTSPDGITWTARTADVVTFAAANIVYANGNFVIAVRSRNAGAAVSHTLVSSDGISWKFQAMAINGVAPTADFWDSLCFFMGQWYIQNSTGYSLTSRDLYSWTYAKYFAYGYVSSQGFTPPAAYVAGGKFFQASPVTSSTILATTVDQLSTTHQQFPAAGQWCAVAFGNNTFVALNYASSSVAASLAVDTTKFRTPRFQQIADTDRLYIKVA